MNFVEMMTLDERGPDSMVGRGIRYPWGGLYGGQIVAQSLVAAASTVGPEFKIHSLHAYFIRRGDAGEPIRFDVDRLRNGRNFSTRAVVASQSRGPIFNMSASFTIPQEPRNVRVADFPNVVPPGEGPDSSYAKFMNRHPVYAAEGRASAWMRINQAPVDDPLLGAAALAFMSDALPAEAVRTQQQHADGDTGQRWSALSLDHALWFHRPVHGPEWQFHDLRCQELATPRGLSVGQVFSASGEHLATVAQEVLIRPVPQEA